MNALPNEIPELQDYQNDYNYVHGLINNAMYEETTGKIIAKKKMTDGTILKWYVDRMLENGNENEVIEFLMGRVIEASNENRQLMANIKVLKEENKVFKQKAYTCSLTNSLNRNFFEDFVTKFDEQRKSSQSNEKTYFIYMDLNKFKEINDTYGHKAGDEVLIEFSRRLSSSIRTEDNLFDVQNALKSNFIARIGGDEYVAKINTDSPNKVQIIKERIINNMKKPFFTSVGYLQVEASVGYEVIGEGESAYEALEKADKRMYEEKRSS